MALREDGMSRLVRQTTLAVAVLAACVSAGKPRASGDRLAAARTVLGEFADPTLLDDRTRARIPELLDDLGHEEWSVREAASEALRRIGHRGEPLVRKAAGSANTEVAARVGQVFEAYEADRRRRVRRLHEAIELLAGERDRSLLDALVRLLSHADPRVRRAAGYGLRRITGRRFGYNAHDPARERAAATRTWAAWWRGERERFDWTPTARAPKVGGILAWSSSGAAVFLYGLDGKLLWSRRTPTRPTAADALPNGHVLIATYAAGAALLEEYGRGGQVVWRADIPWRGLLLGVRRLPNGNTLVLERGNWRVVEIDPTGGEIVWQFGVEGERVYSAQRLANGNTVVCTCKDRVQEVGRDGKVLWTRAGLGGLRDVTKLPGGHLLAVHVARSRVVELAPDGTETWGWSPPERDRLVGARRLPDGRTVIQCAKAGLVLVDRTGKVTELATPNGVRLWSCFGQITLAPAGAERTAEVEWRIRP